MEVARTVEIVSSLADGIDPFTGERYPAGSPYQHPDTVRALFLAVRALRSLEQQERRRQGLPRNAGKPWSAEEDERLALEFDNGTPISRLAAEHERTEGAIEARLVKLGKLEERGDRPVFRKA